MFLTVAFSRRSKIGYSFLIIFLILLDIIPWFMVLGSNEGNRVYAIKLFQGTSMEPTVHEGDLLIISHLDKENLKVGMIIDFEAADGVKVLHRIVAIKENGCFITRGDNNPGNDPGEVCQIDGVMITNIPKLGHFLDFISKKFLG
jgi:signal peptidase I